MEITLELPYPPTINHFKKVGKIVTTRNGKRYQQRYNSPDTINFYYAVWMKINALKAAQGVKSFFSDTIALEVAIDLHPPHNRRSDIDNRIKTIFDSLQRGGLIADDYQIARLLVERKEIVSKGKVIVRVRELNSPI